MQPQLGNHSSTIADFNVSPEVAATQIAQTLASIFSSLKQTTYHPFKPFPLLAICIPDIQDSEKYRVFTYRLTGSKDDAELFDYSKSPNLNPKVLASLSRSAPDVARYIEELHLLEFPEYQENKCGLFSADPLHILDSVIYIFGPIFNLKEKNLYCHVANMISEKIGSFINGLFLNNVDFIESLRTAKKHFSEEYQILEIARKAVVIELGWQYYITLDLPHEDPMQIQRLGESLYLTCHRISTMRIEGEGCKDSYLVFANQDKTTIKIPFFGIEKSAGIIRKLLPLTSKTMYLLCDNTEVYGIGSIKSKVETRQLPKEFAARTQAPVQENHLKIKFDEHGCWKVFLHDKLAASLKFGNLIYTPEYDQDLIKSHFLRLGSENFTEKKFNLLCKIIRRIIDTKHGTTVVFHRDAKSQAKKLSERGCQTSLEIDMENLCLLDHMIAVDGAIMFDMHMKCHAIGLILDGTVTKAEPGTKTRGARYNSALTYVENHKSEAFAVVVSEDGMVDIFPR